MSLDIDAIIDRRNLRRKVSFWRIATILVMVALLTSLAFLSGLGDQYSKRNSSHIAQVEIEGFISNDQPLIDLLGELEENDNIEGVILKISSPGGSTVGGEAIYEATRSLAEKKPVVTTVGTLAASAGYMIASASDHIVARRSSIVGSIGVLFQYADASRLLDKIGVKIDTVKSSPLKAEPSPFQPTSEEAIAMIDRLIQDSYVWFVDIVAERRNMEKFKAKSLADGSIFTGNQGMANGLIDAIGGEDVAVKWLTDERDVTENLEIIEWKPKRPGSGVFQNPAAVRFIARILGINLSGTEASELEKFLRERLLLDGLVSIWQVSK